MKGPLFLFGFKRELLSTFFHTQSAPAELRRRYQVKFCRHGLRTCNFFKFQSFPSSLSITTDYSKVVSLQ